MLSFRILKLILEKNKIYFFKQIIGVTKSARETRMWGDRRHSLAIESLVYSSHHKPESRRFVVGCHSHFLGRVVNRGCESFLSDVKVCHLFVCLV